MPDWVLIYCRQSSTDGEGERSLSLDSQDALLCEHADREGWRVVDVLRDADLKGYQDETERPGLAEILARAEHHEFTILLVYDLSRLARSLRIQENVLHRLAECGVTVVSHREPWVAQPLFRQIIGAVNEEQTRIIAGHIRRAVRERERRGIRWGRPPYGYFRAAPDEPMQPDPTEAPIVAEGFSAFDRGINAARIVDDFAQRGIRSPTGQPRWPLNSFREMLRNPTYAGLLPQDGALVEAAHPAIVDRALWHRIQRRLDGQRRTVKRKPASSWLEGLIVHAEPCGRPLYLLRPRGGMAPRLSCGWAEGNGGNETRCTVRPASCHVPTVERTVRVMMAADLTHLLTPEQVIADAQAREQITTPLAMQRRRQLADQQQQLERRRARAEELFLSGSRDRVWFDAQEAVIAADLERITADRAALPVAPDPLAIQAQALHLGSVAELIADPDLSAEGLHNVLAVLGVVVLGPDGITLRYRPGAAAFMQPSNPQPTWTQARHQLCAEAAALRPDHTWPAIWQQMQDRYGPVCPATPAALSLAVWRSLRRRG